MSLVKIIAGDNNLIPYRKELRAIGKSVTGTILLQQFIYWDDKMNGRDFYKFITPPKTKSDYYKIGDSWTEELGFSKKEFATAYQILEEQGLISKKINAERVTTWHVNTKLINTKIVEIYLSLESNKEKNPKSPSVTYQNNERERTGKSPSVTYQNNERVRTSITETTNKDYTQISMEIILFLNSLLSVNYDLNNRQLVSLLEAGYSANQIKHVIQKKYDEWFDTDKEQYIRPSTLFGAKFDEYLNAKSKAQRQKEKGLIDQLVKKIGWIVGFVEKNSNFTIDRLLNLKDNLNRNIFNSSDLDLFTQFSSIYQIISFYKQGELEVEILKKMNYMDKR